MRSWFLPAVSALALVGCATAGSPGAAARPSAALAAACQPAPGGITLPAGFCAVVVADVSRPRHMVVAENGDVFLSFYGQASAAEPSGRGGVVALRDADGDGRAEARAFFGPEQGTGLAIRGRDLYFATHTAVLRYRLGDGLEPVGKADTLVRGLPAAPGHVSKTIALGDGDALFVTIGSSGNACQPAAQDRQGGVPGQDPCPELASRGGVWRFDADRVGQTLADGERWATGVRNAVALDWNPADETLYAVSHGREMLQNWTGYTAEDNATRVAEELQRLTRGSDHGWPYCYFDLKLNRKVLNPEYGGNGQEAGRCAQAASPLATYPAHSAPNDMLFYTGRQFPARYRGGVFISFHGQGNPAAPGYRVVFQPFSGSNPAGPAETFATGFAGANPANPTHRPMALAQGPDGSLYIADSKAGRVWRILYTG